jgi:hypothetical protein
MAKFFLVSGAHQYEAINIEQIRHVTQDSKGKITIYFDRTHIVSFEGEPATRLIDTIALSDLGDEPAPGQRSAHSHDQR